MKRPALSATAILISLTIGTVTFAACEPIKETTPQLLGYALPDDCTDEEKERHPIAAEEVVEALKGGKEVEIINAVIEGPFILKDVVVEGEVTIERTKIKGSVDFSYTTFKRVLSLKNSTFETDANFTAATIEKDIFLDNATFLGSANFLDFTVTGVFSCNSTTFKNGGDFNRATFKKIIFFKNSTFEKSAYFRDARIGGNAEFTKAEFKQKVSFSRVQIEGGAFFNPATFEGEAVFTGARIGSQAKFDEAEFKQEVRFNGAQIGGNAVFSGTQFEGKTLFYASQFKMDIHFDGAVFEKDVSFENTSFRTVFFGVPDKPGTETKFGVDTKIDLRGCTYVGVDAKIDLRGCTYVGVDAKIDLRGCTYERIYPTSMWKTLLHRDRLRPYDRQPFTQMEETFRKAGEDSLANAVYYERKNREFTWISPLSWMHWLLTGYGVKLWRLIPFIIFFTVGGMFVFHCKGAIELKKDVVASAAQADPLSYCDAFWLSLNQFLPVEIPSGANWKTSSDKLWGVKFTTFATALKISGWILVPVAVAGLSGILKR